MDKTLTSERHFAQNPSMLRPAWCAILGICGAFFLMGAAFIPYAGIQDDEALFSTPIYQNYFEFRLRAFHHQIPLMLMTYIGTLKTALYWIILKIFPAGAYSVRLPMVFVGALTVFFFFRLADMLGGRRIAWIATLLLASDPIFLLTDTFDWGPVAIEHFLLVTGIFAVVLYYQSGTKRHSLLATGFFCLGLAVWNKAIFLWTLTGLVAATLVVCHQEIYALLKRPDPGSGKRLVAIGAVAFIVGASPFILYNIRTHNATFRASAHLEIPDWSTKFMQVRLALDGTSLFGYLVSNPPPVGQTTLPAAAPTPSEGVVSALHAIFGEHTSSATGYAMWICLLLASPLWWRSRLARFSLVLCTVTWLIMATTKGAGGSAHHVVFLWPFPQLFIATVLTGLPSWKAGRSIAIFLVFMNLLVINQYLFQIERDGPGDLFTDAINGLSSALSSHRTETVYLTDWGIQNPVALLSKNPLKLENAEGDFNRDDIGEPERNHIAQMARDRGAIFVRHAPGLEVYPGSRERVARAAADAGLHAEVVQTIADAHGRPVFEILRWSRSAPAQISR
jgi:hypothetical protein